MNETTVVSGETWAMITCDRWPTKVIYHTPEEASCHLREFAVKLLEGGRDVAGLSAYHCSSNGVLHYHIGRLR